MNVAPKALSKSEDIGFGVGTSCLSLDESRKLIAALFRFARELKQQDKLTMDDFIYLKENLVRFGSSQLYAATLLMRRLIDYGKHKSKGLPNLENGNVGNNKSVKEGNSGKRDESRRRQAPKQQRNHAKSKPVAKPKTRTRQSKRGRNQSIAESRQGTESESGSESGSGSESDDEILLNPPGSIIFGSGSEYISRNDAGKFAAELYHWQPAIELREAGVGDKVDVFDTEKRVWFAAKVTKTNRRSTFFQLLPTNKYEPSSTSSGEAKTLPTLASKRPSMLKEATSGEENASAEEGLVSVAKQSESEHIPESVPQDVPKQEEMLPKSDSSKSIGTQTAAVETNTEIDTSLHFRVFNSSSETLSTRDPFSIPKDGPPLQLIELENDSAGILVRPVYTYSRPPFLDSNTPWFTPRIIVASSSNKFTTTSDVIGPSAARGIAKIAAAAYSQDYKRTFQDRHKARGHIDSFTYAGRGKKRKSSHSLVSSQSTGKKFKGKPGRRRKKEKKAPRLCIGVSEPELVGQEVTLGHSYNIKRKYLGKRAIVLGASPISGGWFEIAVIVDGKAIAQHRWRRKAIIPIRDLKGNDAKPTCKRETVDRLLKEYRATGQINLPESNKRKMKDAMRIALAYKHRNSVPHPGQNGKDEAGRITNAEPSFLSQRPPPPSLSQ